ncbi:hypothetical protein EXIGLDRAFT_778439 [Exidia glandulosa HHB12029]|uniref:Uncharacterized protein n=1 Tax=Exidia glandulosa HHB12029 TaxID=1314781 RepID=A0A165CII9_EXIGL|nr:hypothetical protein EXIGLDRAFT_778439 [Exidia glandulosa HHB12029]
MFSFKFVKVLLAASLAVSIASGATIPVVNETIVESPGVFFTADIHFQGTQKYFPSVPLNLCINMPSDFNRIASSWGPDAVDAPQAPPPKLTTQSPGIDDLTQFTWVTRLGSGNWNDAISSFVCSSI